MWALAGFVMTASTVAALVYLAAAAAVDDSVQAWRALAIWAVGMVLAGLIAG